MNNKTNRCVTCLSYRRLVSLQKLRFILGVPNSLKINLPKSGICWECYSVLLNFQKFKEEVYIAHNILSNTKAPPSKPLSSFSVHINTDYDFEYTYHPDPLDLNEEIKTEDVKIKEEYKDPGEEPTDNTLDNDEVKEECSDHGEDVTEDPTSDYEEKYSDRDYDPEYSEKKSTPIKTEKIPKHKETVSKENGEPKRAGVNVKVKKKYDHKFEVPQKCDECDRSFIKASYLRHHKIRQHGLEKIFTCDICNSYYSEKSNLELHIIKHNADPDKVKKMSFCTDCNMQYKNVTTYNAHLKNTRHAKKAYSCPGCNKEFISRNYRDRHYNFYHLKNENVKCELCNKVFLDGCRLRTHNQVHHGLERPRRYACNICDKKFFIAKTLRHHKLTHSEERTFLCTECGDSFKQRAGLYTHERMQHNKYPPPKKKKNAAATEN